MIFFIALLLACSSNNNKLKRTNRAEQINNKDNLVINRKLAIKQRVEDGLLTQEEANKLLAHYSNT